MCIKERRKMNFEKVYKALMGVVAEHYVVDIITKIREKVNTNE